MSEDKERDPTLCAFYEKTGTCGKGELCGRIHRTYPLSRCLLFHHLFPDPTVFAKMLPEGVLSISSTEKQRMVDAFYLDVVLMVNRFGPVEDVVICGNKSDHLNGNVLVMFKEVDAAYAALAALDGCYYAGRKVKVSLIPLNRISNSICRGIENGECAAQDSCNYVHPLNPSDFVTNECFPRSLRVYAEPFRKMKKHMIPDTPTDLLYGKTRLRKNLN